jgi:hypothetical protein
LRRQLIKERDERQYEDSMRITTVIKQAEVRVLERCIVECMEEANAHSYSEEERVAILTAAERLKEMRDERVRDREEHERARHTEQMRAAQNQMLNEQIKHRMYNEEFNRQLGRAMTSGKSITSMVMDEAAQVRWSKISNPKEWL